MMQAENLTCCGNRDFLDAIFTDLRADEFCWTAQFKTPPNQATAVQWSGLPVSSRYENTPKAHAGWNHYFSVSALKPDAKGESHRRKTNFSRLFCVVLDDASPIPEIEPTWVIETSLHTDGSSNTQVGYRLTVPVDDVDLATRLHQALSAAGHLGADPNGNNPVRYVRLPWGWNTKSNPPHANRLLYWSPETTTNLETLITALRLDLGATAGGAPMASVPISSVIDPAAESEWMPKARKLAWDGALRTHNDPKLGRNSEIFRLGAYAARDRLPADALEFILQEFVARMRPTNTSGQTTDVNWPSERATIRRGYEQGHADGVPPLVDLSAFCVNGQAAAIQPVTKLTTAIYRQTTHAEFPDHLINQAPGKIGEILAWGLRTAPKPQPLLALQAAILSVMAPMARRYCTNLNNWPMLWMLGMAVTASGKEHGKTMIEEILSAAKLDHMVSGSGYTSPGAVFSSLMDHPAHIALVDEFGKLMESSQAFGNQIKSDAITMLMEVFGRGHGIVRPSSYSFMALSREQREALQSRKIYNPAIFILATTTPETFYSSLSQKWIADGFLGRILTCESPIGRVPSLYPTHEDVPDTITQWALDVSRASCIGGVITHIPIPSDTKPDPIQLIFSSTATSSIRAFESDVIARMNRVQRSGLEVLLGRTVEKAMRLSMGVCLAERADRRTISDTDFQWAKEYTLACDSLMVEKAKENISDSEFGRVKHRCLELLRAAGARGLTFRELGKKSAAFDALKPREQKEVMDALNTSGAAELRAIETMANRGRKRTAWVALAEEEDGCAQNE